MGDEGVGVHVVRALERDPLPPGVSVLDGGTGGFHLLGALQAFDTVVLVDATMDGHAPGTIGTVEPRFVSDFPRALTAHDIGLRDLIAAAALLGPLPRMFLVTVSIANHQALGDHLSGEVALAVPAAIRRIREILDSVANEPGARQGSR